MSDATKEAEGAAGAKGSAASGSEPPMVKVRAIRNISGEGYALEAGKTGDIPKSSADAQIEAGAAKLAGTK